MPVSKSLKRRAKTIALERKLSDYRRFLKGDEDYDWHFIIRMLRFKLERTRKHIVEHNFIQAAPRVGKEIQQVVDLLERIEDNKYFEELHKPFWKKYGKPKMKFGKPDDRGSRNVTVTYPKETAANRTQIHRESLRISKMEHKLRARDLERAFKLMQKHIWGWWD